jgi:hypothetical protein
LNNLNDDDNFYRIYTDFLKTILKKNDINELKHFLIVFKICPELIFTIFTTLKKDSFPDKTLKPFLKKIFNNEEESLIFVSGVLVYNLIKYRNFNQIADMNSIDSSVFLNKVFKNIENMNIFYFLNKFTKKEEDLIKKYILKNMDELGNRKIIKELIIKDDKKKTNKF